MLPGPPPLPGPPAVRPAFPAPALPAPALPAPARPAPARPAPAGPAPAADAEPPLAPAVAAALARLEELHSAPVAQHVDVLGDVHRLLQDALATLDEV